MPEEPSRIPHLTKLDIILKIDPSHESVEEVVSTLPQHSASSFKALPDGRCQGDFIISCPIAPELAEGDFVDDFAPHLRALLDLKTFHSAQYELHIAVGSPAADTFRLDATSVALLASLGASITISQNNEKLSFV